MLHVTWKPFYYLHQITKDRASECLIYYVCVWSKSCYSSQYFLAFFREELLFSLHVNSIYFFGFLSYLFILHLIFLQRRKGMVCLIILFYHATWEHSISTFAEISKKLTFLAPWYTQVRVCMRGGRGGGGFGRFTKQFVNVLTY